MSADAKAWTNGSGYLWCVCHDGDCLSATAETEHRQGDRLTDQLAAVERCMGQKLRWEIRAYPDGEFGLVGYVC